MGLTKVINEKNVVFRNAFSVKTRLFGSNTGYTFALTKQN